MGILETVLLIITVIFLIFFLICFIPVGVQWNYSPEASELTLKIWKFSIRIPQKQEESTEKKEKKKKKKKKDKKNKKPEKTKKKSTETTDKQKKPKKEYTTEEKIELVKQCVPLVLSSVGKLKKFKTVEKVQLEIVVGSSDPVEAVLRYGQIHGLLGAFWQPLDRMLEIQDGRARVSIDFEEDTLAVYGIVAATITVGRVLRLGIHLAWGGYKIFFKKEESSQPKKKATTSTATQES